MKKKTVSQLKKKLDAVFSLWVRTKYADWKGEVACYTCGIKKPVAEIQNGHFVRRSVNSLRFDERNCRPQCVSCNVFKRGNYPAYALNLVREQGPQILEELDKESRVLKQWTVPELEDLIERYKKDH